MGYPQIASSSPPNPDVQDKGTTRISPVTFLFFFFMNRREHRLSSIHQDGLKPLAFIQSITNPFMNFLLIRCLKCNNPWLATKCLAMGNDGNFSHHVSALEENKLSIDANHHRLILASSQHGITQKMQFIFNWYPSIIQINGIAQHPI